MPEHAHAHHRSEDVKVSIPTALLKKAWPVIIGLGIAGGGGTGVLGFFGAQKELNDKLDKLDAAQTALTEKVNGMNDDLKDIKRLLWSRRDGR